MKILSWLVGKNADIVGVVLNPMETRKFGKEIVEISGLPKNQIFTAEDLMDTDKINLIKNLKPDLGLSVFHSSILQENFISIFKDGIINLHTSLLPYNRGAYPNVWSIIDQTPSGVTIHYIDEGLDTGNIIAQEEVVVEPTDTGQSLYLKLEDKLIQLFKNTWCQIQAGSLISRQQEKEYGTYHNRSDVDLIDEIDLNKKYLAKDLINIIRARTFPPNKGTYFIKNGKKIYININLERE